MIARVLALVLTGQILVQPLHANGGGYFRGGLEQTGDVAGFEPKATENIRMLDEKLTISLGQREADVEVRYLMRNETDKKVKVRFGFPVEESFDSNLMIAIDEKPEVPKNREPAYCRNYQITAAGKTVKAKWQGEVRETKDPRFKGIAGWLISEITFAANEEKPVLIRFQSSYPLEEWSVSEDDSRSAAIFRYRLSTAACWAGNIGSGRIVLKPNGINPDWLRVLKPVNRFKKEGSDWVWNFENLEPTLADDLEIEAKPSEHSYPGDEGTRYIERNERWTMAHTNYRVKASSTLPPEDGHNYDATEIQRFWPNGMWSEGANGPGVGEWLEMEPAVPRPLVAINMLPGCQKSDALFKANARPKKILVELNGEHQFAVEVPDLMDSYEIPIKAYAKPVKKIRLTFQEVYPGNRFEDLCVSGVSLHVRLDKKPKIQPTR